MRSRNFGSTTMSVILLSTFLVACGEDTPLSVGDPLNSEEAAALGEVLFMQGAEQSMGAVAAKAPAGTIQPWGAIAAAPMTESFSVNATVPCPLGGEVTVDVDANGTYDDETGDFDLDYRVGQFHDGCVAPHEGTGVVFTLTGEPGVTLDAQMSLRNETDLDFIGSLSGRVGWETDDERSGSCAVDVDFALEFDGDAGGEVVTGSASLQGHVCGVTISQSVSFS